MTMTLSNYFKSCCRKTNHGVSRQTLYCLPNKDKRIRINNIKPWQHVATWMRSHFKALSWCTSRVIHSSSCELTQHVPFKASWEDEFPFHRWDMLAAWSVFQRIGCVTKLHPFHRSSLGETRKLGSQPWSAIICTQTSFSLLRPPKGKHVGYMPQAWLQTGPIVLKQFHTFRSWHVHYVSFVCWGRKHCREDVPIAVARMRISTCWSFMWESWASGWSWLCRKQGRCFHIMISLKLPVWAECFDSSWEAHALGTGGHGLRATTKKSVLSMHVCYKTICFHNFPRHGAYSMYVLYTIFCFMIYVSFKKPCPSIATGIGINWIGSIFGPNRVPW